MKDESVVSGLFGLGIGLVIGIIHWIYYSYFDVKYDPSLFGYGTWEQTFFYLGSVIGSFILWLTLGNLLWNSYGYTTMQFERTVQFLFAFTGSYLFICFLWASFFLKIIIGTIVTVGGWLLCLNIQDEIAYAFNWCTIFLSKYV